MTTIFKKKKKERPLGIWCPEVWAETWKGMNRETISRRKTEFVTLLAGSTIFIKWKW